MKCSNCGAGAFERRSEEHVVNVAGRKFTGKVAADVCDACGESLVDASELARVELEAARAIGDAGLVSGETFRFMRHALGLIAKDLSAEFDVAPETISRWENEERPLDRLAWATLAGMVRDRLEGHERTREQLRAIREPKKLAKTVHVGSATRAAR